MEQKQAYISYSQESQSLPLYMQPWWLNAVAGESDWDVLLHYSPQGELLGLMPYYLSSKSSIALPPFTQFLGSLIVSEPLLRDDKFTQRRQVHEALMLALPTFRSFRVNYSPDFTDWLPYYWMGYEQSTRYTYRLDLDGRTEADLWAGIRPRTRAKIKQSEKQNLKVVELPVQDLLDLCEESLNRQGEQIFYRSQLEAVAQAAISRKQGAVWGVVDDEGKALAVNFIAWDSDTAYNIASGQRREGAGRDAMAFLLYESIRYVAAIPSIKTFDFEGSMIKGVELFFRSFAAVQTPYFAISKGNLSLIDRLWRKMKYLKQQKQ